MNSNKTSGGSGRAGGTGPVVYFDMSVSLDGYVNDKTGGLQWHRVDGELFRHFIDNDRENGGHIYGRKLYESMLFWETAFENPDAAEVMKDEQMQEYTRIWKSIPKLVVSRTLTEVTGNAELVNADLKSAVESFKAQSTGNISVGGPTLAASLARLGLVDEFRLYITPVVIGGGTPFFLPELAGLELDPIESRQFANGVTMLRYACTTRGDAG